MDPQLLLVLMSSSFHMPSHVHGVLFRPVFSTNHWVSFKSFTQISSEVNGSLGKLEELRAMTTKHLNII